ncbi:MAG TPA: hypothetical protein HPP94_15540 [Desulfuromonadales bacterium]|nr:hypothetical protein [Desulfuromonadales bacterium]
MAEEGQNAEDGRALGDGKCSNSATSSAKSGGNVNMNQSIALGEAGLLDIFKIRAKKPVIPE